MEHRLLELGVHLWGEVLVLRMEVLGLVLEVMQRLQRVLQCLVLELMVVLVVVVVLMMLLEMIMVVLVHDLLVHIMSELLGLVFEELLKLLGGLLVRDKPVLQRESGTHGTMGRKRRSTTHCSGIRVEMLVTCEWTELMWYFTPLSELNSLLQIRHLYFPASKSP